METTDQAPNLLVVVRSHDAALLLTAMFLHFVGRVAGLRTLATRLPDGRCIPGFVGSTPPEWLRERIRRRRREFLVAFYVDPASWISSVAAEEDGGDLIQAGAAVNVLASLAGVNPPDLKPESTLFDVRGIEWPPQAQPRVT